MIIFKTEMFIEIVIIYISLSYQQNILFPHVEVVAEGAGGRQKGRHDHQEGDDGGQEGVRGPLVGRVHTGILTPLM